MKESSLRRLPVADFDADLLRQWAQEGRVYVRMPQRVEKDAYKKEVLEYVRAIDGFAADEWKDGIDELWNEIVEADCMSELLVMKKGRESGHMNRYMVTNIVRRMLSAGVYRKEVAMMALHLQLEHAGAVNRYYKNCQNYKLPREVRMLLKSLFTKF